MTIHPIGHTNALAYALKDLKKQGCRILSSPEGATHIVLPVPSFDDDGNIKGGGPLPQLPKDAVIIGGNLSRPELTAYNTIDLLRDDIYLAKNAAITAHCAIKHAMNRLPVTLDRCEALVIGWGRIGKCLAQLLGGLGAQVTVAARKSADRAMIQALGYGAIPIINMDVSNYRVIFNTVPVMVLPKGGDALKIDLASRPGIGGEDVIWARGLPGKDAPESSGKLIAETILRLINP